MYTSCYLLHQSAISGIADMQLLDPMCDHLPNTNMRFPADGTFDILDDGYAPFGPRRVRVTSYS